MSLEHQGLYSENGRYKLAVNLLVVDKPSFGFDMTTTTKVEYVITDSNNGSIVLQQQIEAAHTATVSDALMGVERVRLANEGSAKRNIQEFLNKLSDLHISGYKISMAK